MVLCNVHGCRTRECTCQNFYLSSHLPAREKHGAEVRTMPGSAEGPAGGGESASEKKK